jgi:hypothetical protein
LLASELEGPSTRQAAVIPSAVLSSTVSTRVPDRDVFKPLTALGGDEEADEVSWPSSGRMSSFPALS